MVNKYTTKIREFLGLAQAQTVKASDPLSEIVEGQRRGMLYNQYAERYKILEHPYNYTLLYELATKLSPDLRSAHENIIKECVRNSGHINPRFNRKCPLCQTEFQTEKIMCPDCNVETVKPSVEQKQLLQAFLKNPNRDDELIDIQVSCFRYMLSCSDWYISIQKHVINIGQPTVIYVEDSTHMHVCVDVHGNLGNNEYFCPACTAQYPEEYYPVTGVCRRHPYVDLKETAYIYKDGAVKGRWAKDEMLHGKLDYNLPSKYGLSRVITCLQTLYSLAAMSQFNLDTYSDGKIAKIIGISGMNQKDVNEMIQAAKDAQNKPVWDPNMQKWIIRKLHQLYLGLPSENGEVSAIDIIPDPKSMQSLDWYRLWQNVINTIYGVQDIYSGTVQQGSTGSNPRMKIDIQNNTTEYYQKAWSDPFNNVIVEQVLGVTDWIYSFNPVEEKDDAQDQAILSAKLDNIRKALDMGMQAELTDEQTVKISGQPTKQQEQQASDQQAQDMFDDRGAFRREGLFNTEKAAINDDETYIVTHRKRAK